MENGAKTITQLPAGITQEMVNAAKEKHGENNIYIAELPLDDSGTGGTLAVLLCVPTRNVLGQYERWAEKEPNKAKEILVNGCLLNNKDQVKADDALFFTCVNAIADLIPIRKAIVKKL